MACTLGAAVTRQTARGRATLRPPDAPANKKLDCREDEEGRRVGASKASKEGPRESRKAGTRDAARKSGDAARKTQDCAGDEAPEQSEHKLGVPGRLWLFDDT
jgi:hypothetical protein